ncbi:hypothetical protein VP01_3631g1 [Puccinia sorghi]|uniref:Uncharacterized protein n=1 Tax=Puccinia sorghi TaxID=27349 RepID=A0A0L6UWK8_9BASI|nr:hypothetical protein VP01_3631g1 [Puccinia sorghi]
MLSPLSYHIIISCNPLMKNVEISTLSFIFSPLVSLMCVLLSAQINASSYFLSDLNSKSSLSCFYSTSFFIQLLFNHILTCFQSSDFFLKFSSLFFIFFFPSQNPCEYYIIWSEILKTINKYLTPKKEQKKVGPLQNDTSNYKIDLLNSLNLQVITTKLKFFPQGYYLFIITRTIIASCHLSSGALESHIYALFFSMIGPKGPSPEDYVSPWKEFLVKKRKQIIPAFRPLLHILITLFVSFSHFLSPKSQIIFLPPFLCIFQHMLLEGLHPCDLFSHIFMNFIKEGYEKDIVLASKDIQNCILILRMYSAIIKIENKKLNEECIRSLQIYKYFFCLKPAKSCIAVRLILKLYYDFQFHFLTPFDS